MEEGKGWRLRRRFVRLTPDELARRRFERMVAEVVAGLPPEIHKQLDNVDVVVEDEPSEALLVEAGVPAGDTLLGYYQGVPHPSRGAWYGQVLPDKITIFRRPLIEACGSIGQMRRQIRKTVVHELAHHFGIGDDRLRKLDKDARARRGSPNDGQEEAGAS